MMRILKYTLALCLVAVFVIAAGDLYALQPPSQDGFVPVEQLGNQEQLPATPLVAAAYGVAWAAILVYVWTIWRRLARVEREIAEVSRRITAGTRR
jgi:CcmD family protein